MANNNTQRLKAILSECFLDLLILIIGEQKMPKDSQIDPKEVREAKAHGGQTLASEEGKNHNRTHKKQSASRDKPNSDK